MRGHHFKNVSNILQLGDPIELRYKEHMERGPVIDQLIYCINSYREAAMSNDPKFDHIDMADKQKVSSLAHSPSSSEVGSCVITGTTVNGL